MPHFFLHSSAADLGALAGSDFADLGFAVGIATTRASRGAVVAVATSAASAIKLDSVASPGHTVAIASTTAAAAGWVAEGRERRRRAAVEGGAAARQAGANGGRGADVPVFGAVQGSLLELIGQVIYTRRSAVVCLTDMTGRIGLAGLWGDDLGWGQRASLGDLHRLTDGSTLGTAEGRSGGSGRSGCWNIEDIERSAGSGFLGRRLSWVMRDVVTVHDVLLKKVRDWVFMWVAVGGLT